MQSLVLTAGNRTTELLWALTVLPFLVKARPDTALIWECPDRGLQEWLRLYPELAQVVGDVEMLKEPPGEYRIIHPLWLAETEAVSPLDAIYKLAGLKVDKNSFPRLPFAPAGAGYTRPGNLLGNYICFDPLLYEHCPVGEGIQKVWTVLLSYIAVPVVQLGSPQIPLLEGMIDARESSLVETACVIANSQLYLGGDSDTSCLASALKVPQIWFNSPKSSWWWPRSMESKGTLVSVEQFEKLNLTNIISQAWMKMGAGGEDNGL